MTDSELIEKKLAFIETCVRELREFGQPDRLSSDVKEERFASYTLQIAIQAALDVASHIVSDQRLGEPPTSRDLFALLAKAGWLTPELRDTMNKMVGFRNVVVHGYQTVDIQILRDVLENRLGDLIEFATVVRDRARR